MYMNLAEPYVYEPYAWALSVSFNHVGSFLSKYRFMYVGFTCVKSHMYKV